MYSHAYNTAEVNVNNRAFSPYAIDGVDDHPVPKRQGLSNPGYENSELDLTRHHYEDPVKVAAQISQSRTSTGARHKSNRLYEPTTPEESLPSKTDTYDNVVVSRDSWLSKGILFLILILSLVAMVLVIMIIFGKLGPSCSCENTGLNSGSTSASTGSSASLEPLVADIEDLKSNLTHLHSKMTERNQEIQTLKAQLKLLNTSPNNSTPAALDQNLLNVLSSRVNSTAQRTGLVWNMVNQLNMTDQYFLNTLLSINNTLSSKVDAVAKMEGPTGPRGHNGSQGPMGPKGSKGDQGVKGDKGDKGDQGIQGIQGFNGSTGAKGEKGEKGLQGDPGPAGANGIQGDKGDQGVQGPQGLRGFNGTQGPKGDRGVGDLSACVFKIGGGTPMTAGIDVVAHTDEVTEADDKRIFVAGCSTNRGDETELLHRIDSGKNKYRCKCKGQSSYTGYTGSLTCKIAYIECPRNS